jgi:hypothetical protein
MMSLLLNCIIIIEPELFVSNQMRREIKSEGAKKKNKNKKKKSNEIEISAVVYISRPWGIMSSWKSENGRRRRRRRRESS